MKEIKFWIGIILFIAILNFLATAGKYYLAESQEYCNDKGFWVKTAFTGQPIGIAMYNNGTPVTCEYKVENSK